MVTAPKYSQNALNVSGSVVTLITGVTAGVTQVSSIFFCNTSVSTRTVTLLMAGTGASVANEIMTISLTARGTFGSTFLLQLANSPLVMTNQITLRAYQDAGTDVIATCNYLEVT
jgi:hypothetical protein